MERWKVAALVLGGMVVGTVYGAACGIDARAESSSGGARAVLYLEGSGSTKQECPTGFSNVGDGPVYTSGSQPTIACLED